DSVPRHGHYVFGGGTGMDLVVAEDRIAIVDGWARAQHTPIVTFDVRLLADPERAATVHLFDVRAEHGAHVIVLEGQDIETVMRSWDASTVRRRGVARVKKNATAVFLEVDDITTELLGWRADELVGRTTLELVHPEDADRAVESWMEMRAGAGVGRAR